MEHGKGVDCPSRKTTNFTSSQNESSLFCQNYSDTVICWPTTISGSLAVVRCPEKFNGLHLYPGNATRFCYENGTWQEKANYTHCLQNMVETFQDSFSLHSSVHRKIYYVGFSVSVVALSIALFLFLFFRCLRCLRNTIHSHLIAVFILKHLLYLKMVITMPILIHEEDSPSHQWICKLILTLFYYLLVTSFFWMLIEGLYLHTILVWSFSHDKLKFWHCAVIGWCVPAVFTIAWAIVRWREDSVLCINLYTFSNYDFIYIAPIFIVLVVNTIFLASTVWILWTKLKASSSSQHLLYRKTTKATLILFPLLGITYLLLFYSPDKQIVFEYINAILQSFQGLFVAIIYCFTNFEVQSMVKKKVRSWRDNRQVSMRAPTSTVILSEQMSLNSTGKDDIQSKTKGAPSQVDSLDVRRESPTRITPVDRGYANGFGTEQSKETLLKDQDKEFAVRCGEGNDSYGFIQHDADNEEFDYEKRQEGKAEEDDDEQDIIKEDLV